jgi:N-acetylglucosaminyldiphosphoundecaprenol N-acetyl-beta-D-mannosaminyltransferase
MSDLLDQRHMSERSAATHEGDIEPAAISLQRDPDRIGDPFVRIFDVDIVNLRESDAIGRLHAFLRADEGKVVYFLNAHTLNLASQDPQFRTVLKKADMCMGDGIGVRLAALSRGVKMLANLNGTDLLPALLSGSVEPRYRYFLLGLDEDSIKRASKRAKQMFPRWTLAGYHHGYMDTELSEHVIERINASECQLLLVGMGNPLQEFWIARHRQKLRVPLSIGVGGLLDYWAGNLQRAPLWMRRSGLEWLFILCQQPRKFQRYIFGNPLFIARMLSSRESDRRLYENDSWKS